MFLPAFRTYFTMVLYVNGGRSSSSLSIFFPEGQNLNFSSFSLTRYKSRFASSTKCSCGRLIILIILPAIVCTHFTLHKKKQINKGLQSLRQKKKNETKGKGALKFSSVFNHLKQRVAYLQQIGPSLLILSGSLSSLKEFLLIPSHASFPQAYPL